MVLAFSESLGLRLTSLILGVRFQSSTLGTGGLGMWVEGSVYGTRQLG